MRKLIIVAFIIVSACAERPTAEKINNSYYGIYPDNYQEVVKKYMAGLLFDPYSAVYENWRGPSKGYSGGNFIKTEFGYRVCVDINAKNRMGGYVGRSMHYFVIRDGVVVQDPGEMAARELCNF